MTRKFLQLTTLAALAAAVAAPRCAAAASSSEVVALHRSAIPAAPDDPAWKEAPLFTAPLLQQDMVEPRLMQPSTDKVEVRAITDGQRIAFRLDWADRNADDLPGIARYSDACAVQLPARTEPDVPAPQMGETNKPVEISYWRAFWQSTVDGRPDTVKALYPNSTVDHYPFEATSLEKGSPEQQAMARRYAPAHALGNEMGGPRDRAVQDLVAEGPGTIRPAPRAQSEGRGVRSKSGWSVVLSRPLPKGLQPGQRTQVAFAVWEGSHQESGARKMRSVWVPLLVESPR